MVSCFHVFFLSFSFLRVEFFASPSEAPTRQLSIIDTLYLILSVADTKVGFP